MKKRLLRIITALMVSGVFLTGCGSNYNSSVDYMAEAPMYEAKEVYSDDMDFAEMGVATEEAYSENHVGEKESLPENDARKLIRNVDLNVETESFDNLMLSMEKRIGELGGYIEQMHVDNGSSYYGSSRRYASLTVRIPAESLDAFLETMAVNSNITGRTESVRDVTLQYVDVESHLEALRVQQKRLLELAERADTIEEIVFLESELTDVRYQIQSLESSLRTLSNQVSYSTVDISVEEVTTYTPVVVKKTNGERIKEGFIHSWKNLGEGFVEFFVGLVIALPYLLIWAIVLVIVFLVIRAIVRKAKKKNQARYAQALQQMVIPPADYTQPVNQVKEQEDAKDGNGDH